MARITVVNDYPDFIELMTSVVNELAGHEVIGFDATEVTLEDLVETRPDLLIADLGTADAVFGNGGRLDQRAAAALGPVPVIVCSGDIAALRERADEFGDLVNVYSLEKPFTLDVLIDVLERALFKAALSPVWAEPSARQTGLDATPSPW